MKKVFLVITILLIVFSICACGTKTETIEVTADNWQQYFEVQKLENWQTDEFGDTSALYIRYILSVKTDYIERIVLEKSDVAVEYIKYEQTVPVEINFANKTCVFGDVNKTDAFENKGQDRLLKEYDKMLDGYYAVMTSVDPVVFDEYSIRINENGDQEACCAEFFINRIQGTIVVKIP